VEAVLLFHDVRRFVVDLDGTLIRGREVVPGARCLLQRIGGRFVLLSNNSTQSEAELAAELFDYGLITPVARILLAGMATVDLAAEEHPGATVLVLGSPALRRRADERGLLPAGGRPAAVVLARDTAFSYRRLEAAVDALRGGSALYVANPDLTHPGENGGAVPETGALLQALLACTGPVAYRLVGKPADRLFCQALRRLGGRPAETLVIGDNPETDGVGAERLGMRFVRVGSPGDPTLAELASRLALDPPARSLGERFGAA
jgi:HAD superfamily hydrolase (TIGR01450 family)